ncbi:hypothetical protein MCUN1_003253 [Malassezia cuniculi]|uniref:alanine--glyoxylate transaminase n=1 Tax=Malassezia cuniculi TaxID=948313 RepID=A0AAF0J838_9BASI|nr:hypothetical protein MCUN1_003253 [Malassezia cuniculi]
MSFKQDAHKLLMIPGPIEVSDEVLYANAHPSVAHVAPDFIAVFSEALKLFREVLRAPNGQPIFISGSGTLGWDQVAANLTEAGDEVLVLHTGYFADGFADALETYGAKPTQIKAPVGARHTLDEVRAALEGKKYKAITITHVDTSTGVLHDVQGIAKVVKEVSPDTLIIVDGVCSVASEPIEFDAWGLDVVLTGSQKGLGCPPGLSLLVASPRAIETLEKRSSPIPSYYASWKRWLPVMKSIENSTPAYFATPPTNLIYAVHASLKNIIEGSVSLDERFELHRKGSEEIKKGIAELGLEQLVTPETQKQDGAAHTMTAVLYPSGFGASDILPRLGQRGIVCGGGLHKEVKDKYFRIGHMGISVTDPSRGDLRRVLDALREVLAEIGYKA